MILSELYSVYYNVVAAILTRAAKGDVSERELQQLVVDRAFSESVMTIMPSLRSGKWPLLHDARLASLAYHTVDDFGKTVVKSNRRGSEDEAIQYSDSFPGRC